MSDIVRLEEALKAKIAMKKQHAQATAVENKPAQSIAERQQQLDEDDESLWTASSFGGGSRSILPQSGSSLGIPL